MKTAIPGHASFCRTAAASLLLGLCAQATAATGESGCDHTRELTLDYPVPEFSEFTVEMIDHGPTSALSVDEPEDSLEESATTAAPLAELRLPHDRKAPTDEQETDATTVDSTEEFNTRLPGTSEEDLRRYREQMYRTDI